MATLLEGRAGRLQKEKRLIRTGHGNFRDRHEKAHALMENLKTLHEYRDGRARKHDWHSGRVAEAAGLLLAPPQGGQSL